MSIKHWPAAERPREKLLMRGAAALSDAELLAIFLRTGVRGKSAVDLARELLVEFGGLRPLLEADLQRFCRGSGLGEAKYVQLQAVLEMSSRHLQQGLERGDALTSPAQTRRFLSSRLRHLEREVFMVLYLDNRHRMIAFEELFKGSINSAEVHPRELIKRVLHFNAAAVILAHNHPSGIAEPSQADREITQRLRAALALVDVRLLDHMVVGDTEVISLAELGCL
ncbi:MAG: DNA repair protein RadC [Pseudomonadales bacterium]|nr:DNA repair protein RadC [Pseudomonadales bacterium]MCC6529566.1 DNA repair protein RadC [Pseudomonadales bacterium]MCP5332747.1 DNA repair protein RadC [Pseudomonadales bacterium]HMU90797.1 DNA repair protein RadC [Pseudomonadales bacterium]HMW14962.1 DNA repair protein RadC [Pseudomonadales bacterium]